MHVAKKKYGRNYVRLHKNGPGGGGGLFREGFCPAPNTDKTRSCPASQILSQNF